MASDISVPLTSAPTRKEEHPFQGGLSSWLRGGWSLYCCNWLAFSGFQLLILSVSILLPLSYLLILATTKDSDGPPRTDESGWSFTFPELSAEEFASRLAPLSCLMWPLFFGHIFVDLNSLRSKVYGGGYCAIRYDTFDGGETDEERVRFRDFLSGYYLYFPLLGLLSVHGLLVLSGLLCLIVPGLYLLVVLFPVEILYIEYHHAHSTFDRSSDKPQPFSFWQAFTVSAGRVHRHFLRVFVFTLVLALINCVGFLTIIGSLVTIPYTALCAVTAFDTASAVRVGSADAVLSAKAIS